MDNHTGFMIRVVALNMERWRTCLTGLSPFPLAWYNKYVCMYIYIYGSAHRGYILRTGEILYVFTTSSMDMWQLAILILWIAWGGDFLWGLVVFGLHNFSHTDTASFRPRSQLVPVSIQILSHETLSGNNLCPLYGAIHRPLIVYVSAY